MALLDQYGNPLPATARKVVQMPEQATPTLAGVRPVFSGHPAEGLTPSRLAAIHRAAAQGDSLAYMELAEDIEERDLHYAAVLGTRKRQVTQLPLTVEAASDDAEHVRHKDLLVKWLRTGVLNAALLDMADAIGKGFSVLEIEWRNLGGEILPARLIYRPQRWFEVSDEDGEEVRLRDNVGTTPLAEHKFVVHRHPSKSGLIVRSGLARLASWAWMYKSFTLRDWAIFVQNYGSPIRVGRYGPDASEADKRVLWSAVSNIAGDCAAIIPKSMDLEFVEVAGVSSAADTHKQRADWLDQQISKAVLGQTTTTDAISGGHAVSQEHRLVQEDIERADAALLAGTITAQLFRRIVAFNFPSATDFPTARLGRPDEVPLEQVIAALDKLGPQGLEVEASEMRDRLGFSEPAAGAVVIGGRKVVPTTTPPAVSGATPVALQTVMGQLVSRHAANQDPEMVELLTRRLSQDAQGALAGLTDQIRVELQSATDMRDLADRISRLKLDPQEFAEVMGRALALANLVGQAALLDEMRGG
jgi:phage gp29-like protein